MTLYLVNASTVVKRGQLTRVTFDEKEDPKGKCLTEADDGRR
jgi:hypothetical protein